MADATISIPADHPVFAGHFPGAPIVPGVMLLERVLIAVGGALNRSPSALRVREAKFFTPLRPDERAELQYQLSGTRCTFTIQCNSAPIARGVLEWDSGD